jgi:hypothetical protein
VFDDVCGTNAVVDNCSNCGGPGGADCWDGTVCCSDSSCDCRGFDGCGGSQVDDCAGVCNGPGAEFTCNVDGSMCGPGGCAPNGTIAEVCDDYLTTCPDGTGCCDDALCGCGNVCGVNDETFTCGATDYECTISDDACAASIADVCGPYLNDTLNCCTDVVMDCAGSCGGSATDDDCGCNAGAYTGTCPNASTCCGPVPVSAPALQPQSSSVAEPPHDPAQSITTSVQQLRVSFKYGPQTSAIEAAQASSDIVHS